MAERKIFAVGYLFPGGAVEQIPYNADRSLLDADVIVFEPKLEYFLPGDFYQGKPSLPDHSSFEVREHAAHWRSELKDAIESGKTVVLFLAKPQVVWIDTGRREHTGTGRNRQTTRIVEQFSSYAAVPMDLQVQPRSGEEIAAIGDLKYLAPYWKEYEALSPYEATISGKLNERLLRTRTGDRIVGAAMRSGRGTVLLLPPLRYDEDDFTNYGDKGKPDTWNSKSVRFGEKLAAALLEIDKVLRSEVEETPSPEWVRADHFRLRKETEIEREIAKKTKQIVSAQEKKRDLERDLRDAGSLRALLFEKGKPLERAVREALEILGFSAQPFKVGESEFDVVFSSEEGRFLGEVEGKDNKAVNIDKLSQLERNLQEDFARDEVEEFANGVLFANAFRLSPLSERGDYFTQKCASGAKRGGVGLVRTPDLFFVAKYLRETGDADFAKACRQAVAAAKGDIAQFPDVPAPPPVEDSSESGR